MLVLSRKKEQRVLFPNLGISVEILRINGNTVRVGVDAPKDVHVLRGELADSEQAKHLLAEQRRSQHELNNHLNGATLALHLLKKQLEAGQLEDAESTLNATLATIHSIDSKVGSGASADAAKRPRALVVEDNANERNLLSGYLKLCGYDVESVDDGMAAMTYLATHQCPDVVLLDMHMPGMDGPATVSAIRGDQRYRDVKLFAVSGSDRIDMGVPLGEEGVNRWFAKPLQPDEFEQQLKAELSSAVTSA
ncbi:MAG: response regulator [Pirellulaceae bacterium]|nr:response regulator [Pirellulaceae bacterium]